MIKGIGTDIVDLARVRDILGEESRERFLHRVLTAAERSVGDRKAGRLVEYTAGRFAAKEAVAKAAGSGIGAVIGFQDIEIVPDALGKPICVLSAGAVERLGLSASHRVQLSISHSGEYAVAFAVIEDER